MKNVAIFLVAMAGAATFSMGAPDASGQQMPANCPLHAQHMTESAQSSHDSHAGMLARGERAMGFNQLTTSHHFRLRRSGGAIEVHVNNPQDREARSAIRKHLAEIAIQFSRADFSKPLMVHGEKPAGVDQLTQFGSAINYTFEPSDLGGRVKIVATSADALKAVHDFLRYQIREHRTGDPLTIENE
jgi:hypothetical protein